eukprot:TRINITY_DN1377_c0_g1_i1.p1 TRINITY_DN1377_c0_g1~~TRINITY_DN1377_c0_g1_i1.p1  ORF type:complete len:917 (-),score=225.35 TRINITY_DN1377_c0_g1_i1:39-2789(-)
MDDVKLKAHVTSLNAELAMAHEESRSTVQALEADKFSLQQHATQVSAELMQLQTAFASLQTQVDLVHGDNVKLQHQLTSVDAVGVEVSQLRTEKERSDAVCAQQEEALRVEQAENSSLRSQLHDILEENTKLQRSVRHVSDLEGQLGALQRVVAENEVTTSELVKAAVASQSSLVQELQLQLEQAVSAKDAARTQLTVLQRDVALQARDCADAKSQLADSVYSQQELRLQLQAATSERQSSQNVLLRLQQLAVDLHSVDLATLSLSSALQEINNATPLHGSETSSQRSLDEDAAQPVDQQAMQAAADQLALAQANTAVAELTTQLKDARQQLQQLDSNHAATVQQLSQVQAQAHELRKQLQQKLPTQQPQAPVNADRIQTLQAEVKTLRREREEINMATQQLQDELNRLRAKAHDSLADEQLRELKQARQTITQLRDQLRVSQQPSRTSSAYSRSWQRSPQPSAAELSAYEQELTELRSIQKTLRKRMVKAQEDRKKAEISKDLLEQELVRTVNELRSYQAKAQQQVVVTPSPDQLALHDYQRRQQQLEESLQSERSQRLRAEAVCQSNEVWLSRLRYALADDAQSDGTTALRIISDVLAERGRCRHALEMMLFGNVLRDETIADIDRERRVNEVLASVDRATTFIPSWIRIVSRLPGGDTALNALAWQAKPPAATTTMPTATSTMPSAATVRTTNIGAAVAAALQKSASIVEAAAAVSVANSTPARAMGSQPRSRTPGPVVTATPTSARSSTAQRTTVPASGASSTVQPDASAPNITANVTADDRRLIDAVTKVRQAMTDVRDRTPARGLSPNPRANSPTSRSTPPPLSPRSPRMLLESRRREHSSSTSGQSVSASAPIAASPAAAAARQRVQHLLAAADTPTISAMFSDLVSTDTTLRPHLRDALSSILHRRNM